MNALRDPHEVAREIFVRFRWLAIAVLILALGTAWFMRADVQDESIRVTAKR